MKIGTIELNTRGSFIKLDHEPEACPHSWEPHLWDQGRAYCPGCGSYAEWLDDPRVQKKVP